MLERSWAISFAAEWLAAWNSHDLDKILEHYADDFTMCSPLIVERMGVASGVLQGKAAIRPYWQIGLASQPPLCFELIDVYLGVDGITLHYKSLGRRFVTETLTFNADRQVIRAAAYYGAPCPANPSPTPSPT